MKENHGGGRFAKKTGSNRKIEKAYETRVIDYAKMIGQREIGDGYRDATGYPKPGSRKKIY